MLAIPVFRNRVAPVLNWSTRVLIVLDEVPEASQGEEFVLSPATGFELLRSLQEKGVHTVICGALSRELFCYASNLGLKILCGVSGPVLDVLCAYRENQLQDPRFRLPGCRGQRQYRGECPQAGRGDFQEERRKNMPGGTGTGRRGGGQGRGGQGGIGCETEGKRPPDGMNPDSTDFCMCTACGTEVLHQRGIPCTQMRCPECDQPMVRK